MIIIFHFQEQYPWGIWQSNRAETERAVFQKVRRSILVLVGHYSNTKWGGESCSFPSLLQGYFQYIHSIKVSTLFWQKLQEKTIWILQERICLQSGKWKENQQIWFCRRWVRGRYILAFWGNRQGIRLATCIKARDVEKCFLLDFWQNK